MYTLYNGNCLETISLLPKIDCIIADLPYFQVVKDEFDNIYEKVEKKYEKISDC